MNVCGEEFGELRLMNLLVANRSGRSVTVLDLVKDSIAQWRHGSALDDDTTMTVAKYSCD